jgi:SUR7/PalI family
MARTGFFHHVGTFLLFAATILLIVTCISAPVVHNLSILKVELGNQPKGSHSNVAFGSFGYCINDVPGTGYGIFHKPSPTEQTLGNRRNLKLTTDSPNSDACSPSHVGYEPADIMNAIDGTKFSDAASSSTHALTKAMILHPIACGLNFIAFLLALGAGIVGSLLASIVALVAFILTVVVMIIDFVLFNIIRSNVNDDGTGASATYGAAAWTVLVSAICSLFGTIIVFFTCCSARLHRRHGANNNPTKAELTSTPRRRRRWF